MKDRFKFRIWDNKNKRMEFFGFEDIETDNHLLQSFVGLPSFYFKQEPEIMQCTGRVDSRKKLVYEYDIIKTKDGKTGYIKWNNAECCYDLQYGKTIGESCLFAFMADEIEVIGNKYGTPELLEARE